MHSHLVGQGNVYGANIAPPTSVAPATDATSSKASAKKRKKHNKKRAAGTDTPQDATLLETPHYNMDPGAGLRHDRLRSQGCNCFPHFREVEDPGELVECRFCFTKFGFDCCLSAVGGKSEGPYGTYYTCHRCAYKYEDPKCNGGYKNGLTQGRFAEDKMTRDSQWDSETLQRCQAAIFADDPVLDQWTQDV